jgi:Ni2+-binding GTPase involved in maturation of urease and hydrogenase
MKLSEVVKVIKPNYVYVQLTPNNSIKNNNTDKIARAIASIHKTLNKCIKKDEAKLIKALGKDFLMGTKFSIHPNPKVSYYIYIEKKKVEFYFIIPEQHYKFIKEKISLAWQNITCKKVDVLPEFSEKATYQQMVYEKEDGLSLKADHRENDLLRSNFNIIDVLEEGEKVGIFYNFIPTTQFGWNNEHKYTINKAKSNQPLNRNKFSINYAFKFVINIAFSILNSFGEVFAGKSKAQKDSEQVSLFERALASIDKTSLSERTLKKGNSTIVKTQIALISESPIELNQHNNIRALSQSYESITQDNRLIPRTLKPFKFNDYSINAEQNKMSDAEISNFISLPGRELLDQYPFISKVETQEIKVPEDLQKGTMHIGDVTYRGSSQSAFLSSDREYKYLPLILIGPQRAGKTTLLQNLTKNAIDNGECVIIPDFIKNCEFGEEVAAVLPKDKVLKIECNDHTNLQGLGFNEVKKSADPFIQYANAKKQATQFITLINSLQTDDSGKLTNKMRRYLEAASLLVFIQNGSFNDVFTVLQDHNFRAELINKLDKSYRSDMKKYVSYLLELDEIESKSGNIIGTKFNLIVGVIDRLNTLEANPYLEKMLQRGCENNVDLLVEMQKPQLILIKMPEHMFMTDDERDVYCTYWLTKIYLALQLRAETIQDRSKQNTVNVIFDELYQVQHTESLLKQRISRMAKFNMKPIVSCHYLNQIKILRDELRSANASYMLISGCDKENFREFKEELHPFEQEDLLKLKRFYSLNLIKNNDGYAKFITKLPKPVGV